MLGVYMQLKITSFPTHILIFLNEYSVTMAINDMGMHRLNWRGIKHQINSESMQHLHFKQVFFLSHQLCK